MTQTTVADGEDTQNGYEDAGVGGPGAPTPLAALVVRTHSEGQLLTD